MHPNQPTWVLVDGCIHAVSDYAQFHPRKRPIARCPVCNQVVILKLGTMVAHHYAHRSSDLCPLTNPETLEHFNAKMHLYNELTSATTLVSIVECKNGCGETHNQILANHFNEVRVEYKIDSLKPDVSLYLDGNIVLAIEIEVSHPIDRHKVARYKSESIEWIEIKADAILSSSCKWSHSDLVPIKKASKCFDWECIDCIEKRNSTSHPSLFSLFEIESKPIHTPPPAPLPEAIVTIPEPFANFVPPTQDPTCRDCGRQTKEWWSFDPITNTCRCYCTMPHYPKSHKA